MGISTSLAVPRLLAPGFIKRRNRNLNWTRFTLDFDILNRPHYFKMAQFNFSFNYDWQSSRYSSHTLTPFKLTYTNLLNTTQVFDSITSANPAIALSFRSQYIPQLSYTYTYDRAFDRDNAITWQTTLQEAGNLFSNYAANMVRKNCSAHRSHNSSKVPPSSFITAGFGATTGW